ncbi:MAG: TetR/AcrR family transcriptional regulator [Jatrophihabitantaceae bacterium]
MTTVVQRKRGAALEDAILEAAYAELSEVGYTAFTVEGVAARARTGKASIYRRWPTRAQLMLDAVNSQLPTPAQCGFPIEVPDDLSTADALRRVAQAITALLDSPAGDVMRSIKCEAATDPDLARAIDDQFQAPRRAAMLALLRRGIERGEVRPGADTALVADVLPAVLMHRVILQREPVSASRITEIIEQVLLPLIEPR